jgi:hypothetical protein
MGRPPIGIAVLAFFAAMAGFAYLLGGFRWVGAVAFGPVESGNGVVLTGVLAILAGAIYLAVGAALWSMRPWAWLFAMIVSAFGLFEAVLVIFATGSLAAGLGAALLPGIVLWYLNTGDIKAAFVEANSVASGEAISVSAPATKHTAPSVATDGPDGPTTTEAEG